jgi:Phage tail tube protein, TTP/Ubiquitin-activating enzyme E1 FCCH domain
MNVNKWSGVGVAMQSAIAAAKTITGITQASPGVVTATGHGYTDGDYVLLVVTGMNQVNGRVFRIDNSDTNTFELEGENTTDYDTFAAGSAYKLTLGTTISTLTGVSGSGGDFNFIDTTTIHDHVKTQIPGIANPLTFGFDSIWDVADTGLIALNVASKTQAQTAFKFTFSTGQIIVFMGYVGASLIPGGSAQDKVTTKVDITAFGVPTYYAS